MTDRRREFEAIRRENAEMAAMGFGEDINEEMEMGPSEPEPKKRNYRLTYSLKSLLIGMNCKIWRR